MCNALNACIKFTFLFSVITINECNIGSMPKVVALLCTDFVNHFDFTHTLDSMLFFN